MSSGPSRDLPSALDPPSASVPEGRSLPPHRNKLERVGDHVAAISADLQEYVELRIALAKAEVNEKKEELITQAQKKAKPIGFYVAGGFFGLYLLGFTFALIAAGFAWIFGASEIFPPAFFGILVAWGLLLLLTVVPILIGRRLQTKNEIEATLKATEVPADSSRPTRAQIQDQERTHARQSAV
ncbi:MAG: phage holin family protein [Bacteroidota bacterium]